MATVLTLNVRTNRISVLSVSLYFLGNYIFLTTKRDLCDSTLFSQIPSPFHYRSIVCPQFFISIPLARDYYGYYDYHYSYYDEYSRSQWISRLQFYWNFELTPRVRSENELPMKLTQLTWLLLLLWLCRHFELPSTVRAENEVASTSWSGNGYTGTLIRRVALTHLVTSLFPFHPLRWLFHLRCSSRSWFPV